LQALFTFTHFGGAIWGPFILCFQDKCVRRTALLLPGIIEQGWPCFHLKWICMNYGRRVGELDEDSLIIFEDFWEVDDKWRYACLGVDL
jgi:hypothetical protein